MDPSGGAGRGTVWVFGCGGAERPETRFEIAFPESVSEKPITGRLFLAVSPDEDPEPRIAAYNSARSLQVYHPDFFGGTWTFYPDPVDFRQYQLINIYEDDNAFVVPGASRGAPERMFQRRPDGQPVATVRQVSQMEHASGTRGRSGAQVDIWSATYGPVGEDGYPRQLWDLQTGVIDREVAYYMRDNGYDLRHYLETRWPEIGPKLVGKIRIYNPEMDDFYLPNAVYLLEEFLESTTDPYYGGEVVHGRPMKGHGWQPMTTAELIRMMAEHIAANAPAGADASWRRRRAMAASATRIRIETESVERGSRESTIVVSIQPQNITCGRPRESGGEEGSLAPR